MDGAAALAKTGAPVHLKVETGLHRMGFTVAELRQSIGEMKKMGLNIIGVFSHLSDADNPKNNRYSKTQLDVFRSAVSLIREAGFAPRWIHIAASAGALKTDFPESNLVRLGLALYGINPYQPSDPAHKKLADLRPALALHSTLTGIREVAKGKRIGYGQAFTAKKKIRIGVIPTGYSEALPRTLGNTGVVEIAGKYCKIIGRVCMNYILVDLGSVKPEKYCPVIVYSSNPEKKNSISHVAALADTIPNEIFVRISESLRRVIV